MELSSLLTGDKAQTLNQLASLLHLFNHRNKNQHRRSLWWKHFSIFRRQFNLLNDEIGRATEVPATHVERARQKKERPLLNDRVHARLAFWQDILVAKWHAAFSQLAADGRFAAVGLVLLAVLAEICTVTGIIQRFEELAEVEIQETLLGFGSEEWQDKPLRASSSVLAKAMDEATDEALAEDFGVSLVRESAEPVLKKRDNLHSGISKIRKAKKIKHKTGNAIDDLFGGL